RIGSGLRGLTRRGRRNAGGGRSRRSAVCSRVYLTGSLAAALPAGDEWNSHKQRDGHKRDRITKASGGTHGAAKSLCASSLVHRHASLFASPFAVRSNLPAPHVAQPARQHILVM